MVMSANPLNDEGADPPLRVLFFHHCEPQNVTELPATALRSQMTNEPAGTIVKTVMVAVIGLLVFPASSVALTEMVLSPCRISDNSTVQVVGVG